MRRFRDQRLFQREESRFIWAKLRNEHGHIKPVTTRCTDEAAATLFADEWERRAADPSYKIAVEATLGSAIADFLSELRRKRVSAATLEVAETKLGHFVRLWGPHWQLLRTTNTVVLEYIDRREAEYVSRKKKKLVTPSTIKKELSHLTRVLVWAHFRGTFPPDVTTVIPPNYSSKSRPKSRTPTPVEVAKLIAQMRADRGAHVAFIVATGARWSESVRACRVDVDLKRLMVALRGTKTDLADGSVPITGLSWMYLAYALEHAPESEEAAEVPLFRRWSSGSYWRDLQAACVRAGIAPVSPNDLRRSFGKWHRDMIMSHGVGATSAAEQVSILLRHTTDKLAQTTYASTSGADLGPMIRAYSPVAILTAGAAEVAETDPNASGQTMQNTAKTLHARGDSNTRHPASKASCLSMPESPRSVGNRRAHERRRAASRTAPVSIPTVSLESRGFRARARRWLTRAA